VQVILKRVGWYYGGDVQREGVSEWKRTEAGTLVKKKPISGIMRTYMNAISRATKNASRFCRGTGFLKLGYILWSIGLRGRY